MSSRATVTGPVITERDLEHQVAQLAKLFGWERYHTFTAIHSPAGYPDDCLCRPPRLLFLELKSAKGKLTERQERWGALLSACPNIEYRVIRPDDLPELAELMR